jgi:hypothetical protein
MTSCYNFETLPHRIKSDSEIAIPVIDTTVSVGDFIAFTLPEELLNTIEIPEGTPINMGELEYPFFIGEYSASQKIGWIEPFLILETKDLPFGTTINIKIYTKDSEGKEIYFWLPENNPVTISNVPIKIPETPVKLTNIEQFRYSKKIFFNISVTYPTAVPVGKVIQDRLNIRVAIKFEIETDLIINL